MSDAWSEVVSNVAYMMAPLEEHYDDGFGAVGEAFLRAAELLGKASDGKPIFLEDLPEIFLLRHAIELFLKSGIIIMHRRLRLPFGPEPSSSPKPFLLTASGAWKTLYKTHDLAELYWYWKKLLVDHNEALTTCMKFTTDIGVPPELDRWIDTLGALDPNSDYFRYPVSKNRTADKEKSPFKEVPMPELFPSETTDEKVHALVTKDSDGNWLRAFKHDRSTNKEIGEAAHNAARELSNFHAMMRFEFTGGW